jgi:hypothetical protein
MELAEWCDVWHKGLAEGEDEQGVIPLDRSAHPRECTVSCSASAWMEMELYRSDWLSHALTD